MSKRKRHNHRNLKIWQLGTEIMKDVYDLTNDFPKRENFRLTSQLTSCAVSMPSNIAEGSARTDKSFSNFLDYSLGSSFELGTQLIAAQHAKYITEEQFKKLNDKNNEFQRMTIGFMGKL
ncbi:MAG: four helix bundle protein [Rivularia sp. (in: cyanobacteria)]